MATRKPATPRKRARQSPTAHIASLERQVLRLSADLEKRGMDAFVAESKLAAVERKARSDVAASEGHRHHLAEQIHRLSGKTVELEQQVIHQRETITKLLQGREP